MCSKLPWNSNYKNQEKESINMGWTKNKNKPKATIQWKKLFYEKNSNSNIAGVKKKCWIENLKLGK